MGRVKYETPEELQEAVDSYFTDCKGAPLLDKDGDPVMNKYGEPIIINAHVPTVTGLALALGYETRMGLLHCQHKSEEFDRIITIAKSRCEEYAESRLYDNSGVNGAKFSLKNNFKGWSETPDLMSGEGSIKISIVKEDDSNGR